MNGFISRLISRHTDPGPAIHPRLPGRYEPLTTPVINLRGSDATESQAIPGNEDTATGVQPVGGSYPASVASDIDKKIIPGNQINKRGNEEGVSFSESLRTGFLKTDSFDLSSEQIKPGKSQELTGTIRNDQQFMETADASPGIFNDQISPAAYFNKEENNSGQSSMPGEIAGDPGRKNDFTGTRPALIIPGIIKTVWKETKQEKENITSDLPGRRSVPVQGKISPGYALRTNLQETVYQPATPAVIKVSIGKIEVRAMLPSNPAKANRDTSPKPKLSLEDYLKKRNSAEQ